MGKVSAKFRTRSLTGELFQKRDMIFKADRKKLQILFEA